jgi:hypothetical protein
MSVTDAVRRELEKLCRGRRTRMHSFSPTMPTHWSPQHVRRPDSGEAFSDDSAWTFIADLLGCGHEIEVIILDKPPGKTGYVLKCDGHDGEKIYMKIMMGSGKVIGRSFHVSERKDRVQ